MKKLKPNPIYLLGITLLFAYGLRAQSIHFDFTDGSNSAYNLEDVRKITFNADVMNLYLWDGSTYSWNVSTIGNYRYELSSLNLQDFINDANSFQVTVFPNLTSTIVNVRFNLFHDTAIIIAIYDLNGNIVLERNLGELMTGQYQEILDVNKIPSGTYFCRVQGAHYSVTKTLIKN